MSLSNRQQQITKFAELEKKRIANNAKIEKVRSTLGAGFGLARVEGNIDTIDPETGQETQVSSKQYGVNLIRQSAMNEAKRLMHAGILKDSASAAMYAEKNIHTQLKKQDVVDEAFAQQVSSAARGTIYDAENRVDEDTMRAFDWYLSMSKDPRLGADYAGGYFKDTEGKALMIEASLMYGEGLNIEQALRKAHERLNSAIPPKDIQVANDYAAQRGMQEGVDAVVRTAQTNEGSLYQWVLGTTDIADTDKQVITNQVTDYMDRSAKVFWRTNPRMSPAAAVKHAEEKAKKAVVQIGDQLVFGDPESGERLDQRMGLQGLPRDSAWKAVDLYIRDNIHKDFEAKGLGGVFKDIPAPFWKKELRQEGIGTTTFQEKATRFLGGLIRLDDPDKGIVASMDETISRLSGEPDRLPYAVNYNAFTNTITVNLYKNRETGEMTDSVTYKADEIGKYYLDKFNEPSMAGDAWQGIQNALGKYAVGPIKRSNSSVPNPSLDIGAP
jgi:hypothetical protein